MARRCPHCGSELERSLAGAALLSVRAFAKTQPDGFARRDAVEAVPTATSKEVSNALAYLVHRGELRKRGYGLYSNKGSHP